MGELFECLAVTENCLRKILERFESLKRLILFGAVLSVSDLIVPYPSQPNVVTHLTMQRFNDISFRLRPARLCGACFAPYG